jgi:hypothetical protein
MKFFLAALVMTAVNAAERDLATQFSIAGGDPPGSWGPLINNENSVTITFDLQGEDTNAFNTEIAQCGDTASFSLTAPVSLTATTGDSVGVTFKNLVHMDATPRQACINVNLYVDNIATAVATRQFTYDVTAAESGTDATVVTSSQSVGGVLGNSQAADTATETATHALTFVPTITTAGAIQFGDTFNVEIAAQAGFSIDVTALSIGTIAAEPNGVGPVSYPTKKNVDILLPLSAFVDANTAQAVTLTVAWAVDNGALTRRALRGLQDAAQNGTIDYTMEVAVVPYEGSYAYTIKSVTYCASAAAAGIAAMLI